MPAQDTSQLKQKIISILNSKGPSLPVHIASEINMSILFASAFLSELLSEKKIKISNMKVGSSPIYFIQGQEEKLENYSQHLKSREKDAYHLLKENKFLEDEKQEPAIRVALREIKDFAIPFKKDDKIYWRYFIATFDEFKNSSQQETKSQAVNKIPENEQQKPKELKKTTEEVIEKIIKEEIMPSQKPKTELDIFDKKESPKPKPAKKKSQKKNEKFFNTVKEFLKNQSIEITGIEGFGKDNLILKIKENNQEKILVAYNKKRIAETDLISAHKKSIEANLPYTILSLGDTPKKLEGLINAIKNLDKIDKIE